MAALEADLRALSAEARRRHPAVKDAAEHATLKVRLSPWLLISRLRRLLARSLRIRYANEVVSEHLEFVAGTGSCCCSPVTICFLFGLVIAIHSELVM
jgi:hypothetical protein